MWIDADTAFAPESVDQLRGHGLPLVAGIVSQERVRVLAVRLLPATKEVVFGRRRGADRSGVRRTGFLYTRREVYGAIQRRWELPVCNERLGKPMVPYFMPIAVREDESPSRADSTSSRQASPLPSVRQAHRGQGVREDARSGTRIWGRISLLPIALGRLGSRFTPTRRFGSATSAATPLVGKRREVSTALRHLHLSRARRGDRRNVLKPPTRRGLLTNSAMTFSRLPRMGRKLCRSLAQSRRKIRLG